MIPTSRPVLGKDLDSVRHQFGLLTGDACYLFGLSITRWMQIVRRAPDEPVKDPSLALMVRFLDQHPELSVMPKFPGVAEMFEMLKGIQAIDQKRFSVLFGSEASATYRWLKAGSRQSPAVNRLMLYLRTSLMARPAEERADLLEDWMKTVQQEGQARGVSDVLRTGQWNPNARAATRQTKQDTEEVAEESTEPKVRKPRKAKAAEEGAAEKKPRAARKTKAAAEAPAPAPVTKKSTGPRRVKAAEAA